MRKPAATTDLLRENLLDERDGVALYDGLAAAERDPERARAFAALAAAERKHAALWERKLAERGVEVPASRPSLRVRTLVGLARRLGTKAVLPFVLAAETRDADKYAAQGGDATALVSDERAHGDSLRALDGAPAPDAQGRIARRERWHAPGRGGSLRAAVFGMNDGIVSNVALVLGVAAAGVDPRTVLLAGLAGLLAGAFSMAVGEYVSVSSQRDVYRRQVELERRELAVAPAEEEAELASILEQKGIAPERAARDASDMMLHPEAALDTLVREELGLDPANLGSPVRAALSSLSTFAAGAVLPLLPFFFRLRGLAAAVASGLLCAAVLAAVGAGLALLSGTGALRSALRMVGLAALAAGATVALGRLFGATLS
ncbi:MAG TPA: VIT1/CCC1 transporter family protein [Myxococcota bacterium]|nr:VIT1/CCC1 transporter family protein [Myxococcota bacterium]